jgi:hypothetical protein
VPPTFAMLGLSSWPNPPEVIGPTWTQASPVAFTWATSTLI